MTAFVFEQFLSTPEIGALFSDAAIIQGMLDFEAALARAQAAEGVIPAHAADAIAQACRVERYDLPPIIAASSIAGTLAIPLMKALTAEVAKANAEAAGFVHWGSTSQDVIDTAMVLATKRALALIDARLMDLIRAVSAIARREGDAPMLGRTLMQPALVISLGFKLVEWAAPLVRRRARLATAASHALKLQLGGAVGTLSVMGEQGPAVARRMAAALELAEAPGNWHTQRDEWVALGCEVGVLCGTLGKIAKDLSLLAQAEVAEVAEPSGGGRGGSSAMPHKRNPVASMIALAASMRAPHRVAALLATMAQEHERGLGNWQAELAEWPGLFLSAHGALHALADATAGLAVDTARMRRNIESLQGLVFAEGASMLLATHIGKSRAHALLEAWSRQAVGERVHLLNVALSGVANEAELRDKVTPAALRAVFDVDAVARRASALAKPQWDTINQTL
ncbi:MAG TPA: 3-carboxy-cis,cis-muconate cycloisomerase [Burkholderiaceae bacterium]|jgi:3-carboxy-cis,cis-muconate cycloisomerase